LEKNLHKASWLLNHIPFVTDDDAEKTREFIPDMLFQAYLIQAMPVFTQKGLAVILD
jgi:hypothetical protein